MPSARRGAVARSSWFRDIRGVASALPALMTCVGSALLFVVGDLLGPFGHAVADGQVDHECAEGRTVPVPLARGGRDRVAGSDLRTCAAAGLAHARTLDDMQHLAGRVTMPGGTGTGREQYDAHLGMLRRADPRPYPEFRANQEPGVQRMSIPGFAGYCAAKPGSMRAAADALISRQGSRQECGLSARQRGLKCPARGYRYGHTISSY
jgi:hypothetical protein